MYKFESAQFIAAFDAAVTSGNVANWSYSGRLLLPGDDAAITVSERGMSILINDALAPKDHPMHEFIADHEVEIREVTATDLRSNSEIILLGRWHDQGDEIESFEPYFTCKTCDEGRVTTTKYGYDFYGIGGDRFGLEFNAEIDGKIRVRDTESRNSATYRLQSSAPEVGRDARAPHRRGVVSGSAVCATVSGC